MEKEGRRKRGRGERGRGGGEKREESREGRYRDGSSFSTCGDNCMRVSSADTVRHTHCNGAGSLASCKEIGLSKQNIP